MTVLEPTKVGGLQDFGESELSIRTLTRVKPGHHQGVAREMRRILKEAFDREGIEIPFPGRVIIFDNGEKDEIAKRISQAEPEKS